MPEHHTRNTKEKHLRDGNACERPFRVCFISQLSHRQTHADKRTLEEALELYRQQPEGTATVWNNTTKTPIQIR
jgi:hypothetical protein